MITLIVAAGAGARFRKAGYKTPKPLLPMTDRRPILAWLLDALTPLELIVVARNDQRKAIEPVLWDWMADGPSVPAGIAKSLRTVWVGHIPNGPLASSLAACNTLDSGKELLISYCDVIPRKGVGPFLVACRNEAADAAALCFDSNDPRVGRTPSGRAVSGLYWFRYASEFLIRAKAVACADDVGIPSVVFGMSHIEVVWPQEDILDLGTPEEYERFVGLRDDWEDWE